MENLRWILIFAGVAILVLLYLSGRQPKASKRQGDALNRSRTGQSNEAADPLLGNNSLSGSGLSDDNLEEALENAPEYEDELVDPLERPGGQAPAKVRKNAAAGAGIGAGLGGISAKIEDLSSRLSPRRRARVAASEPGADSKQAKAYASKIVTLHVVAPEGQLMNGAILLEQFEQRGYHFGDMNIFHSMHDGKTVFSVAKLVGARNC